MRILIFICLLPLLGFGQMINNEHCQAFSDEGFFYEDFIQTNKIKSISGKIATKKEMQAIHQENLVSYFEFDTIGRLVKQYYSFYRGSKKDTMFTTYHYDTVGNLVTKRMNDSYGFFSYNYQYDSLKRVVRKHYCRDENKHSDGNKFELGRQYTIVKESYSYSAYDSILEKNVLNNHGRSYQKELFHRNEYGWLVLEQKKLLVNHKRSETKYGYNEFGLVTDKKVVKDTKKPEFKHFVYKYDPIGNLEYIEEYDGEKHQYHKEVLYDKSTMLMNALLVQEVDRNLITITKYKYTFFE